MNLKLLFLAFIAILSQNVKAQSWVEQATNMSTNRGINDINIVTDDIVWCAAYDGSGSTTSTVREYCKTIDGGTTWVKGIVPATGLNGLAIANIAAFDANTAFALFNPSQSSTTGTGGKVMKTTNGGVNWIADAGVAFNAAESYANLIYAFDNNNMIAMGDPRGGFFEIYRTINGGTNWSRVAQANIAAISSSDEYGLVGAYAGIGDNYLWFGTTDGRIYKTNNKGESYTAYSVGAPAGSYITNLAFSDTLNGYCSASDGSAVQYGIYKTIDGGSTWTLFVNAGDPLGNISKIASIAYEPCSMNWWITGSALGSVGSAYSSDNWVNWVTVDSLNQMTALAFGDNVGFTGGFASPGTGIFKWECTETRVNNNLNQDEAISKGYPNPVQNNYRYESPYLKHSDVMLSLFDITGKVLETKVYNNFSGYLIENFNFTDKSKGIYLLNISINGKQFTQKVVK